MYGLYELIGHTIVIALLHGGHHICCLLALAGDEKVVGHLHALPALVAIHGVEATHDVGDVGIAGLGTLLGELLYETLAALGVGVTTVHETVDVCVVHAILLADLHQFEQVVQAGVYTAVGGQAHQMHVLARLHGILVCVHNLLVLHDGAVGTGAVDLHQVLIHDASRTDVQVTHLGVAHLSVWQTYVLSTGQELAAWVIAPQAVHIRCGSVVDHVTLSLVTDPPSVEDHQKCFLCHSFMCIMSWLSFVFNPQRCTPRSTPCMQSYNNYLKYMPLPHVFFVKPTSATGCPQGRHGLQTAAPRP